MSADLKSYVRTNFDWAFVVFSFLVFEKNVEILGNGTINDFYQLQMASVVSAMRSVI